MRTKGVLQELQTTIVGIVFANHARPVPLINVLLQQWVCLN